MKNLSTLFLICLAITALPAQSWFETNPQWLNHYTQGFSGDGYEYAAISGDTLLNGLPAKIIKRSYDMTWANDFTQIRVVREQGDSIWSWYQGDFHLIYDFSMQIGDTLSTQLSFNANAFSRYVIDSLGQMNVNGETLRFQRVRILYTNQAPYYTCRSIIIEKIGMIKETCYNSNTDYTNNFVSHFFFYEPNTDATDGPAWHFCRFQNEQFTYINAPNYCSALTNVDETKAGGALFSVFPNPFEDAFSIQTTAGQSPISVRLFDISGQLRLQTAMNTDHQFEGGMLPPGLYILEITSGNREKTFLKVIKNR